MYEATVISFIEKEYCMMTEKEQRQAAKAFFIDGYIAETKVLIEQKKHPVWISL